MRGVHAALLSRDDDGSLGTEAEYCAGMLKMQLPQPQPAAPSYDGWQGRP